MKKFLIFAVAVGVMMGLGSPASAGGTYTITFDDVLPPGVNWGVVPNGYMEFDWQHIEVENIADYQPTYNNYLLTFPSAPLAALNGGESGGDELVAFSSAKPFILEGAYFSTWAMNNKFAGFSSHGLTVTGYRDGQEVGSATFSLSPEFTWQDFNFAPVDFVLFRHLEPDNQHWWLMDNVQISATPLPGAQVLFLGGLITLGLFGRRLT